MTHVLIDDDSLCGQPWSMGIEFVNLPLWAPGRRDLCSKCAREARKILDMAVSAVVRSQKAGRKPRKKVASRQ